MQPSPDARASRSELLELLAGLDEHDLAEVLAGLADRKPGVPKRFRLHLLHDAVGASPAAPVGLTSTQRLVLLTLGKFANPLGRAWPAVETLARRSGLTDRTVQTTLPKLIEAGWLVSEERLSAHRTNIYRIPLERLVPPQAAAEEGTPETTSPPRSTITPKPFHPPKDDHPDPEMVSGVPRRTITRSGHDPVIDPVMGREGTHPRDPGPLDQAAAAARERLLASNVRRPEPWKGLAGDALLGAQQAADSELVRCLETLQPPATAAELDDAVTAYVRHAGRWWPNPGTMARLVEADRAERAAARQSQEPLALWPQVPVPPDPAPALDDLVDDPGADAVELVQSRTCQDTASASVVDQGPAPPAEPSPTWDLAAQKLRRLRAGRGEAQR